MKKKLFQYFVLLHKYESKTDSNGNPTRVYLDTQMIVEPTFMIGKNEAEVAFKVTRMISDEHAANPEDVEINVQNF